jgi:hypothetical protein
VHRLGVSPNHVVPSGPPWRPGCQSPPVPRRTQMKLHVKRQDLCAKPPADGTTGGGGRVDARAGGRGGRCERAHGLEVASLLPGQGRAGAARRHPRRRTRSGIAPRRRTCRRVALRRPALHRRRDRRGALDAALDGLCDPDPDRARPSLGAARAGPSRRTATRASGRASSCTSTSRSWAGSAAPATASRRPPQPQPRRRLEYVHVCVDDATRLAHVEVLQDEKACAARSATSAPTESRSSGC